MQRRFGVEANEAVAQGGPALEESNHKKTEILNLHKIRFWCDMEKGPPKALNRHWSTVEKIL